jgi:predicted Zn-dependent protease
MKICIALLSALFFLGLSTPASAQTVIRDTEIEAYMQEWFAPIFKAANMDPARVNIILVQDPSINAFVAGGPNIFFYTGLLQKTDGPGEVIGVMAHELGHITGGHLIRGREAMENASYESILGMILGVGAAIATGEGGAAATIGTGASSMAQRSLLKNSRAFESSADQAALKYIDGAGLNPQGLGSFMKKLEGQELRALSRQAEYVQTHPLSRDRFDSIMARVNQSPNKAKPLPASWDEQHKMMIAKLTGFITPQQVVWVYDDRDKSLPAISARAIAAYRLNEVNKALGLADQLLAIEPNNPYFLELKGQMLTDFGRLKEALPYYEKAIAEKPDAGLIRISLAHVQIETAANDAAKLQKAIGNLNAALKTEQRSTRIHRLLATAYGRMGKEGEAKLHLAEEALLQRRNDYAKSQAVAAQRILRKGSVDWVRAGDIINYVETAAR